MANMNNAEKESFSAQIAGILKEKATSDALKAKKFDPADLAKEIEDGIKALPDLNAKTIADEAIAQASLAAENGVRDAAYDAASGAVNTVSGLLGKDHALTKKLRGIRGEMNPKKPKKPAAPK